MCFPFYLLIKIEQVDLKCESQISESASRKTLGEAVFNLNE